MKIVNSLVLFSIQNSNGTAQIYPHQTKVNLQHIKEKAFFAFPTLPFLMLFDDAGFDDMTHSDLIINCGDFPQDTSKNAISQRPSRSFMVFFIINDMGKG